jgi:CelD/BcsL family acetyltransferase involved in cellulose biosynthesis
VTRIQVVHPTELGTAEISCWHRMQKATPALVHPFLSAEYTMTVSQFRPQSRVGVITEGQRITGFFPFEVRRFGVAVPVSGWLSACQGVVHAPGAQWDPHELLRGCGLSAWQFDNLIANQKPFNPYLSSFGPTPAVDVTGGFDGYDAEIRARAPGFRRELGRKARKLGREVGELRLEFDTRDPALLDRLIAWKSDQYRRTNHVDRFEQPWARGLLHALLAARHDHLTGLLSILYAGDEPVSMEFGLRADALLVGWFTGYEPRFAKYSPGLLQLRMMTEALGEHGIGTLHMGRGAKDSLRAFGNRDILTGQGTVTCRSALGAAHRIVGGVSGWALRTVRDHPPLHDAADQVLRRSGLASRYYGKV